MINVYQRLPYSRENCNYILNKSDSSCEIAQKLDGVFVYNSKKLKKS